MNRIDAKFRELRKRGRKALIAYITVGYPSLAMTERLIIALENAGADIVELGIPFSDPLADGPTIQRASEQALKNGVTMKDALGIVRSVRKRSAIPIVFMTYYNPVLSYGIGSFAADCVSAGVDGVICPDTPFEESGDLIKAARTTGLSTILLLAPTSTKGRVRTIARLSSGFIYYVSVTGVTGARRALPNDLIATVRRLKTKIHKPLCVGFGVSTPAQARALAKVADGIIVGSALIRVIERSKKNATIERVGRFTRRLASAVHHA